MCGVAAAPRLDFPGAFQHLMARGIDGVDVFRDRYDREDFLLRLARSSSDTESRVHAWALQPNHVHLLSESGAAGVSALMRKLLGGYARTFNRRHHRVGHLFQGRFRSLLVEEEPYFLELVRYIHLNPVRSGVVADLKDLACYPWTGHPTVLGIHNRTWQTTTTVLQHFHDDLGAARAAYLDFVSAGRGLTHEPEFEWGRLVRRTEQGVKLDDESKRGRERWTADERVLGSDAFLSGVALRLRLGPLESGDKVEAVFLQLGNLLRRTAEQQGVPIAELRNGSQRRAVVRARSVFCRVACRVLGVPVTEVGRFLAMTPRAVRYLAARAEKPAHAAEGSGWLMTNTTLPSS
jgi:putative transposase